jgi:hypothetical protein
MDFLIGALLGIVTLFLTCTVYYIFKQCVELIECSNCVCCARNKKEKEKEEKRKVAAEFAAKPSTSAESCGNISLCEYISLEKKAMMEREAESFDTHTTPFSFCEEKPAIRTNPPSPPSMVPLCARHPDG